MRSSKHTSIIRARMAAGMVIASLAAGGALGAPDAPPASAPMLQGEAKWSMELLVDFFKKEKKLTVPLEPSGFPEQAMLGQLNQEFAKRLRAMLAVYEARGGKSLGIVPETGGLRRASGQQALYKKGRRILQKPDGTPVGDGRSEKHWGPRTGPGIVTNVWVSWHNLGLAVDFGIFNARGRCLNVDPFNTTLAGLVSLEAMKTLASEDAQDLGLIFGRNWEGEDPPHVEWHPRLRNPAKVAADSRLADNTALQNIDVGYKWKIPSTIYTAALDSSRPERSELTVHELTADGDWICLKKLRRISREQNDKWRGTWLTYDPPVKLFPAYIPTRTYAISERQWPQEDLRWRGKTNVVIRAYLQDPSAGIIRTHREEKGIMHYMPHLSMEDWQKTLDLDLGLKTPTQRYTLQEDNYPSVWNASIYKIKRAGFTHIQAGDASRERIARKWQHIFEDGTQETSSPIDGFIGGDAGITIDWNRDSGKVGQVSRRAENPDVVDLLDRIGSPSGPVMIYSGTLPPGAFDQPTPPDFEAPKKRPSGG